MLRCLAWLFVLRHQVIGRFSRSGWSAMDLRSVGGRGRETRARQIGALRSVGNVQRGGEEFKKVITDYH